MQTDGQAVLLEANQQFLFVLTDAGRLCMWGLAGGEAKPYGAAGRPVDLPPDLSVVSMRSNCDGTKVKLNPKHLHDSGLCLGTPAALGQLHAKKVYASFDKLLSTPPSR